MKIIKVGRSLENDVVMKDRLVSAQHLSLSQNEYGEIFIQDLNSTNGTFVNDTQIEAQPQKLQANDIVKIGESILDWQSCFEEEKQEVQEDVIHKEKEETQKVFSYERLFWFLLLCFWVILLVLSIIWYNQYMVKPKL